MSRVTFQKEDLNKSLVSAIQSKNHTFITLLLDQKADVDARNKQKLTGLHSAIKQNDLPLAKLLIEKKADVNTRISPLEAFSFTCLHLANTQKNPEMIQLLIVSKACLTTNVYDPGLNEFNGYYTPAMHAAWMKSPSWNCVNTYARFYSEQKDDPGYHFALLAAVYHKQFVSAKLLVTSGNATLNAARVNSRKTALHYLLIYLDKALKANDQALANELKEIISTGLQPHQHLEAVDNHGRTAAQLALSFNNFECVSILVNSKAKFNFPKDNLNQGLIAAVQKKDEALIKLLLDLKADVDAKNDQKLTGLHVAIKNHDLALARLLIERKANVDARISEDNTSFTCLHLANTQKKPEMIELLLEHKAMLNLRAADSDLNAIYDFFTPAMHATWISSPSWRCVNIYAQLNPEKPKDFWYEYALLGAVYRKQFESAKLFVHSGATLDAFRNESKKTTLHYLIIFLEKALNAKDRSLTNDIIEIIAVGLQHPNQNLEGKDNHSRTASQLALSLNRHECVEILVDPKKYYSQVINRHAYTLKEALPQLPFTLAHLVFEYLRGPKVLPPETFRNNFAVMSIVVFCEAYESVTYRRQSAASKNLVAELKKTLQEDDLQNNPTEQGIKKFEKRITQFVSSPEIINKKKCRARDLLFKFDLVAKQNIADEQASFARNHTPSDVNPTPSRLLFT